MMKIILLTTDDQNHVNHPTREKLVTNCTTVNYYKCCFYQTFCSCTTVYMALWIYV